MLNDVRRSKKSCSPTKSVVGKELGEPLGGYYRDFVINELIPFINSAYRTKTGPEDTMLSGISLGGAIQIETLAYGLLRYKRRYIEKLFVVGKDGSAQAAVDDLATYRVEVWR